jgi:hypothetical protein
MDVIASTSATLLTTSCDENNIVFYFQHETKIGSKASNVEINEA